MEFSPNEKYTVSYSAEEPRGPREKASLTLNVFDSFLGARRFLLHSRTSVLTPIHMPCVACCSSHLGCSWTTQAVPHPEHLAGHFEVRALSTAPHAFD